MVNLNKDKGGVWKKKSEKVINALHEISKELDEQKVKLVTSKQEKQKQHMDDIINGNVGWKEWKPNNDKRNR